MANITKLVTVETAGTPVQLGTEGGNIIELFIQSVKSNSELGASGSDGYAGYEGVDAANETGALLEPKDSISEDDDVAGSKLAGRKMSEIYLDATEDNTKFAVVARTSGA